MEESISELFSKGEAARKSGNYTSAAEFFRKCWNLQKNEEHAWRLVSSLRHLHLREEAWQVIYEAAEIVSDSELINTQHAWLLYDFDLAEAKAKKHHAKILDVASQITDMKPDGILLQLAVFAASDAAKALNMPEKILEVLGLLDKNSLEKTPREYNGKKILSWRERWYFACINALFELGNFSECRQTALEAYKDFPAKIEFSRKAALCLAEMGSHFEAAEELETLVRGRRAPWYMYSDLARLWFEAGHIDEAWKNASSAAQASGELKTKVNLYYLMARMLMAKGQREGAAAHALLASAARTEQGWSVPGCLVEILKTLNASAENANIGALLSECRKYWGSANEFVVRNKTEKSIAKTDKTERFEGAVLMQSPTIPFAFIKSSDFENNIYVKTAEIPAECRKAGAQVSFCIQSSYDAKKNRQSLRAVEVRATQ